MLNKNFIITINNINDIQKLKELGINYYAWPIKDFCVGYPNTFLISDIPNSELNNSYLYINRILDNAGLDKLKELIKDITNVKGIIFDDLGVLEVIKELNMEKILYLSHFNCNKESIKIYLEYVDSVIVSTDITRNEIKSIIEDIPDKLTLFVLGYVGAMYSRRLLINNYALYHHIEKENPLYIDSLGHKFMLYENEYGTIIYHLPCFNGLVLLDLKAKYYFINGAFLTVDDIESFLNSESTLESDKGFLETETIYKLKGDKE